MRIRFVFAGLALLAGGCAQPSPTLPSPPPIGARDSLAAYLSASYAAANQDLSKAAYFYRESLKGDPHDASLRAHSFFYSAMAGDIADAEKLARQAGPQAADYRPAQLVLAVVALKHGDYAQARKYLSLSAEDQSGLTASLLEAWAAAGAGDHAAADKAMARLAQKAGTENLVAYHAALLAEYEGQRELADEAYRKAATGNSSPRVIESYGRFLERQGRDADASVLYKRYTQNDAVAPVALAGLDRIKVHKKPAPMIPTPQDGAAEVLFGIAAALTEANNADVSILYLRLTLYLRPDLALAHILLADRLESLHKYDEAIAAYKTIDKTSPYYRMALVQAAIDETHNDNLAGAVADLERLTKAYPKDVESWTALGDAYRMGEKYPEALDAYNRAVAALAKPGAKDWPLFYARATIQDKLHDWNAAQADLYTAMKLSPDEPQVLNYLGYSWVVQGHHVTKALVMLQKAHALRPFDGYITDSVGWAYYHLGRYDDAVKLLEDAVQMVPGDPTINDHYGDALWRAGYRRQARFQWDHALTFGAKDDEKNAIEQKLKMGLPHVQPT